MKPQAEQKSAMYKRPLSLALLIMLLGEFFIFIVFATILYPGGSYLVKAGWLLICGITMGAVTGTFTVLLVIEHFRGVAAILMAATIMTTIASICNYLCWVLAAGHQTSHSHSLFGAAEDPLLFLGNGALMSMLGGLLYGWLLFSKRGLLILQKLGL